jgi:hypothetical protein
MQAEAAAPTNPDVLHRLTILDVEAGRAAGALARLDKAAAAGSLDPVPGSRWQARRASHARGCPERELILSPRREPTACCPSLAVASSKLGGTSNADGCFQARCLDEA